MRQQIRGSARVHGPVAVMSIACLVAIAGCSPVGTGGSPSASGGPTAAASPTADAVLTVAEAQAMARTGSGAGPVPVSVGGYLIVEPPCRAYQAPTPTPSPTPDPVIQPCGALFLVAYPVFEGGTLGAVLNVAPDRIPDATWAAAVSGEVWRPVVVAGHFGDPRLRTCPEADRAYCDNLLILDAIVSVGAALPTPTTLDLTSGTPTRLVGAELTVPAGWTIAQTGTTAWSLSGPTSSGVVYTVGTRTDVSPFNSANGVAAAYPGATSLVYDDSTGHPKWSVEFGRDLATRRSLVGFTVDGTTYELRFAWDTPVDELGQALGWFREIATTFDPAAPP